MYQDTTIAAISTAKLNAAIGVVRLSGKDAITIADKIFFAKRKQALRDTKHSTAVYGEIRFREDLIDTCVATVFFAPHSFSGEDTVEFSCHGGVMVLSEVLSALLASGAVAAQAGEFSKRAFLNGKMDLTQAEAVIDLISAKSQKSAALASFAVGGGLSVRIGGIRHELLNASGHIMAYIDYPDEDFDDISKASLISVLQRADEDISVLLGTYPLGQAMKDGIPIAILGKPNVGKSSIMNALVGYDKSIVTEIPGTTRDMLEETVSVGDILINLLDTAGIRQTEDIVEEIGVRRSVQSARGASLLLCVFDGSKSLTEEDRQVISLCGDTPALAIINKTDLPCLIEREEIYGTFDDVVEISATSGTGVTDLRTEIQRICSWGLQETENDAVITSIRHRDCLARAKLSLQAAKKTLEDGFQADMAEIDIRNAVDALGEMTGESASEDILNNIFSRFCVGK